MVLKATKEEQISRKYFFEFQVSSAVKASKRFVRCEGGKTLTGNQAWSSTNLAGKVDFFPITSSVYYFKLT